MRRSAPSTTGSGSDDLELDKDGRDHAQGRARGRDEWYRPSVAGDETESVYELRRHECVTGARVDQGRHPVRADAHRGGQRTRGGVGVEGRSDGGRRRRVGRGCRSRRGVRRFGQRRRGGGARGPTAHAKSGEGAAAVAAVAVLGAAVCGRLVKAARALLRRAWSTGSGQARNRWPTLPQLKHLVVAPPAPRGELADEPDDDGARMAATTGGADGRAHRPAVTRLRVSMARASRALSKPVVAAACTKESRCSATVIASVV